MKNRCIIICAYNENKISCAVELTQTDFIICADGGLTLAQNENILPDLIIGDFDSADFCKSIPNKTIRLPREKDDTDTLAALKKAIELGYTDIIIVGGIGGRLDHTIASIQTVAFGAALGTDIVLTDGKNTAQILTNAALKLKKSNSRYLSVFSYSSLCTGVTLSGVKYPLSEALISNSFPIGVSNEITEETATVSVENGTLLVITSEK